MVLYFLLTALGESNRWGEFESDFMMKTNWLTN